MGKKPKLISWKKLEKRWMKDPKFRQAWEELEPEYQLARSIIRVRLKKGLTQTQLARKVGTKQPVISRLERMEGSPSFSLVKRIARALGTKLEVRFT